MQACDCLALLRCALVLTGLFNFNSAANTTAGTLLLASRETVTMSILVLEGLLPGGAGREAAAVVQIILGGLRSLPRSWHGMTGASWGFASGNGSVA